MTISHAEGSPPHIMCMMSDFCSFVIRSVLQRFFMGNGVSFSKIADSDSTTANPLSLSPDPKQLNNESFIKRNRKNNSRMDGYDLVREVGRGAYGVVYEAIRLRDKQTVALKIVRCGNLIESNIALDEVRPWLMLDHPNVVKCDTFFLDNSDVCVVQEYYPDGDLDSWLKSRDPAASIPPTLFQKWSWDLVNGLAYLHARRICHRDIKPSNSI